MNTVSFGNATLKRQLTNIADGGVYQGSSDAVTGGQLWDTYQRMGTMENNIYREMDDLREDVNVVGAHRFPPRSARTATSTPWRSASSITRART